MCTVERFHSLWVLNVLDISFPESTVILLLLLLLIALLFEGTVDIALRNLSTLSDYEQRKAQFLSGIQFSVEQVEDQCCVMLTILVNLDIFRVNILPAPRANTGPGNRGLPSM